MQRKWWVLAGVAFGTFMATLDSSIVNIALPTLTEDLSVGLDQVKWVVVLYFLVITCLLLPFGKISDLYGRKKVFLLGYAIFTLGSALCGTADSLGILVFSRVVQALGASMIMANGPAVITHAFPSGERGRALGTLAMVVSLGLITGPVIGGYLISTLGWRSIFWVNIPIGILGLVVGSFTFEKDSNTGPRRNEQFDWLGSLLQSLFLVTFILIFEPDDFFVFSFGSSGFTRFGLLVASGLLLFAFIRNELQKANPIFDFSLFKDRGFWSANLAGFLIFTGYSSFMVLAPYFFEQSLHYTTRESGVLMSAVPVAMFAVSPVSGRLSDRFGSRELCLLGSGILALVMFWISGRIGHGLGLDASFNEILAMLAICGGGLALFQSPNNNAIMGTVPLQKLGFGSAFIATVRNLGIFTGAGFGTNIFSLRERVTGDSVQALHDSCFVAALIVAGAFVVCFGKPRLKVARTSERHK